MTNDARFRSPLRKKTLRLAGESINARLLETVLSDGLVWFLAAVITGVITILEWARYLFDIEPNPLALTAVSVPVCVIAFVRVRRAMKRARTLRLGREGERSVAETLQDLVRQGWYVFHDIAAEDFNIDHVAVGAGGVFAIETKTRSKPTDRDAQIVVNASGVSIDNGPFDTNNIEQAVRQAKWLAGFLKGTTARSFPVQPVLLFPGWYINDHRVTKKPWVLEPKGFVKWAIKEKTSLSEADIALIKERLDNQIRTTRAQSQ